MTGAALSLRTRSTATPQRLGMVRGGDSTGA